MADQFDGQGGSYLADANGVRTLVSRTEKPGEATEPDPVVAPQKPRHRKEQPEELTNG
jgi:hypothetical protein